MVAACLFIRGRLRRWPTTGGLQATSPRWRRIPLNEYVQYCKFNLYSTGGGSKGIQFSVGCLQEVYTVLGWVAALSSMVAPRHPPRLPSAGVSARQHGGGSPAGGGLFFSRDIPIDDVERLPLSVGDDVASAAATPPPFPLGGEKRGARRACRRLLFGLLDDGRCSHRAACGSVAASPPYFFGGGGDG